MTRSEELTFRYQVTLRLEDKAPFIMRTDSFKRALEVAQIQIDTYSTEETRSGSLRGDGEVYLWKNGERIGFVRVEEHKNGAYRRIG